MSRFDFNTGAPRISSPPTADPTQPLGAEADPRSQYLAAALQAMGRQPQGSAGGLAANLAIEALLRLGQRAPMLAPGQADGLGMSSDPGGSSPGGLFGLGLGALGGGSLTP